jgi:hypothetical protein
VHFSFISSLPTRLGEVVILSQSQLEFSMLYSRITARTKINIDSKDFKRTCNGSNRDELGGNAGTDIRRTSCYSLLYIIIVLLGWQ